MESVQIWLAVSISVILPGLCLIIIYSLDLYSSSSFRFVLLSFGWGGVGGLGLAYLLNTRILIPLIDAARWDYLILFLFFAPVLEEFLKSIPLLYIYQRPEFTYIVDGAVYGFASGIGFSITENFMYINIFQE